jgi:hypothetical protein
MAQTTGGMSASNMYVGYSTNGTAYTEASGGSNSIQVSGGERTTGAAYTFDGDTAIIKGGKRAPITVTWRGIYSPDADEIFSVAQTAYEAGSAFYLRWSPGGGDAGDLGYTTTVGIIKSLTYPGGEVDSGDPILTEVVLECASITESTIGSAGW